METDGKFFAWHQDLKYFGIMPLEQVSVWIAIDNADEENGAMKFLPGTFSSQYCMRNDNMYIKIYCSVT